MNIEEFEWTYPLLETAALFKNEKKIAVYPYNKYPILIFTYEYGGV